MKHLATTTLAVSTVAFLLGSTSCNSKKQDAQPQAHTVEVRFQATAIPSTYLGNFYVEEDNGSGPSTTYQNTASGTKAYTHQADVAKIAGNTVLAKVGFYPTTGSTGSVANTSVKADIVVDGIVKSSVSVNASTTPKASGIREASTTYKIQ